MRLTEGDTYHLQAARNWLELHRGFPHADVVANVIGICDRLLDTGAADETYVRAWIEREKARGLVDMKLFPHDLSTKEGIAALASTLREIDAVDVARWRSSQVDTAAGPSEEYLHDQVCDILTDDRNKDPLNATNAVVDFFRPYLAGASPQAPSAQTPSNNGPDSNTGRTSVVLGTVNDASMQESRSEDRPCTSLPTQQCPRYIPEEAKRSCEYPKCSCIIDWRP